MRNLKLNFLIIMFIFGQTIALFSADPSRFMVYVTVDKNAFYFDESIDLKISVKNISNTNNEFTVYDFKESDNSTFTTFQPQVYDMHGRLAELIVPYKVLNKRLATFLKELAERQVILAPNEEISHKINLKDIYRLEPGKRYRVKSYFFPDFKSNIFIISSNRIEFSINKEKTDAITSGVVEKLSPYRPDRLLTPKEVILLALHAEKNHVNFEKYINVERLIYSFPNYNKEYQDADDQEKILVEKKFLTYLHRDRHDYILDFKIIREDIINDHKAIVEAIVDRFGIRYTNRYRYKYTMERKSSQDAFWLITYLEAYVIKGVRR